MTILDDLYECHVRGLATLAMGNGTGSIASVNAAPFGLAFAFDTDRYAPIELLVPQSYETRW